MSESTDTAEADHLTAALESTCAALLALQNASGELAVGGQELSAPQEAELKAIEHVRLAIRELRRLLGERTGSPLALGFVRGEPRDDDSPGDHPSSLRMA